MKTLSRQIGFYLGIWVSLILSVSKIFLPSFADSHPAFQEKIKEHWSKKVLRSQVPELYFPEYVEDAFQKFNPSEPIMQSSVYRALNRLFAAHHLSALEKKDETDGRMKRKDILSLLEPFCREHGKETTPEIVFTDCEKLNPEERKILAILADLKILAGVNKKHFAPEREMTQAEAMIVVQRVFDFLERTFADSLPKSAQKVDFTIKHCKRTYDNVEGISFEQDEDSIFITITKRFSTPAYTMHVQRVFVSEEGFHIDFYISSTVMEVPQVITYETIVIAIPKSDVTKNVPFRAQIDNLHFDSSIK